MGRSIKKLLRETANVGLSVLGTGYYFTAGQWFWMGSALREHQKHGRIVACPVCGREGPEFCASLPLERELGLFDGRASARNVYNLAFVPGKYARERMKRREGVANLLSKTSVDYFRCPSCDVYFQNQGMTPAERDSFYSSHYRQGAKFGRPQSFKPGSRFHLWADYLKTLTGLQPGQRCLDVGCAEGFVVLRMKELGFDSYGLEPSAPMARFGQEDLGLENLTNGTYDKSSYPEASFDLISSYHVMEHVNDHQAFLASAVWHLKPGGHLVISVPCPEAAVALLRSGAPVKSVTHVLASGHHLLFSKAYLMALFERHGLKTLSWEVVDRESDVLPATKTSKSGEKWLGMNILAQKPS